MDYTNSGLVDRLEEDRKERRQRAVVTALARLLLGIVYIGLLIALAAPPWAFVLALIAATYWGPPR